MSRSWVMNENVKVGIETIANFSVCLISWHIDISHSANYSFYESWWKAEQFDTIFKKIGATLCFKPCTSLTFTFDLQSPLIWKPWVVLKNERHFWNSWVISSNLIYWKVIFNYFEFLTPFKSYGVILGGLYFKLPKGDISTPTWISLSIT